MTYYKSANTTWQNMVFCAVGIISIATLMISVENLFAQAANAAKSGPSVEEAMRLQPVQKGIDINNLNPEEIRQSAISPFREGTIVGYVVKNPQGQVIRMFLDTDGSKALNQWSYYKDGLEVYRDIDTNGNGKADQYRWFHTGGSRWAIDENEDGVIDYWRCISPEEVSQEVTAALAENDLQRFLRVALSESDLPKLQCGNELAAKLSERIVGFSTKFRESVADIALTRNVNWIQFGGGKPSAIPSGRDGNKMDLNVYQNTMIMLQDEQANKQLVIGSMVRVGDAWKVVDVPHLDSAEFVYNSPFFNSSDNPDTRDPNLIRLSEEIEQLNQQVLTAEKAQRGPLYDQIVNKMIEGANFCKDPRERDLWLTNLADTMRTAVYQKDYPDGLAKMKVIEDRLKEQSHLPLAAYFRDRRIEAQYYIDHMDQIESPENIQKRWVDNLEGLIKDYPTTTSAAKAMLILGNYYEDIVKQDQAEEVYQKIVQNFPKTAFASKAEGAIKRLASVGNTLTFSGTAANGSTIDIAQSKGSIVVLAFWSTWSDSEGSEISTLKFLQERYQRDGLKVIGVNLDDSADTMNQFLAKHDVKWQQIHETGGLESRPACALGVQEPPYYILIDKEGKMRFSTKFINDLDREIFSLLRN